MKRIYYCLLGLLLLSTFSCVVNEEDVRVTPPETVDPSTGDTEVVFNVSVPTGSSRTTRAIGVAEENTIESLYILAFRVDASNQEYFDYYVPGELATGAGNKNQTFTARVQIKDHKQRFVLIANAAIPVTSVMSSILGTTNTLKSDVLARLEYTNPSASGDHKWKANSAVDFTPFPMWGESDQVVISGTTPSVGDIPMLRMVVKVDVLLPETVLPNITARENFKMTEVYLYNSKDNGRIAPDASVLGYNTQSPPELIVTAPTMPGTISNYLGPVSYNTGNDVSILDEIYLPESPAVLLAGNALDATCLVIGGYFSDDDGTTWDAAPSYYRLDFLESDKSDRRHLLRNHRYEVRIVRVKGRGYDDKETAFRSKAINLDAEVVEWNEGGDGTIEDDGQYSLYSPDELTFYSEGNAQTIRVYATHPDGWKVTEKSAWITLSPDESTTVNTNVAVSCDPMGLPNTDREGYFIIESGRIRKTVEVIQLAEPDLILELDKLFLSFKKTPSAALPVNVTTYPTGVPLYFSASGTINWETNMSSYDGATAASSPFYFKPKANPTVGTTLSSIITISAVLDGKIVSKSISVTQSPYDLTFAVTAYNSYPAAGGSQKLSVLSESDWYVSSVTNNVDNIISYWSNMPVTGDDTNEVDYYFTLAPNPTFAEREATFNFGSSDPEFPGGQVATIRQAYTNPAISVTSASASWANASYTAQSFTVSSNAQWSYATSGDWSQAVSAASTATGTVQGIVDAQTQTGTAIAFTPKEYAAISGTPAAGTSYTAYADFATTGLPSGVPGATARLTITRKVPAHWTWMSGNSATAPRAGGNVSVYAATNAWWSIQVQGGSTSYSYSASGYGNKTISNVAIPENTAWSSTTSPVNLTRYTWIYYKNADGNNPGDYSSTSSGSSVYGKFVIYQPGYYISGASTNISSLSANASTSVSVSLTGAYPTMSSYIRAYAGSASLATGTIAAGESGTRSGTVSVPANTTWSSRSVQMQYYHPGRGAWVNVGSAVTQNGYSISTSATSVTAGGGGTSTVTVNGYRSLVYLRAVTGSTVLSTAQVAAANSGSVNTSLAISANPSASATRSIKIQWSNNNSSWTDITSFTQAAGPVTLSTTGRVVAMADVSGTMYWAQALGIATSYNSASTGMTGMYATYTTTTTTGCGGYSETGYPAGSWYVPTRQEATEMMTISGVTSTMSGTQYWTTREIGAGNAYGISTAGVDLWSGKSTAYNVRCVRNP